MTTNDKLCTGDKVICIKELGFMFDDPDKVGDVFTVDPSNSGRFSFFLGEYYEIHSRAPKRKKK